MANIKDTLVDRNPWWKEGFDAGYKEREVYEDIRRFLSLPQIIAFTGLRRVGKTTLMYKIIEDYLKNGYDPKNIIYFPFDEFSNIEIKAVIRTYEELMEKDLKKGDHLLLLDELQKLEGWENQLKAIYDTFKNKVKIIISGSESLFIRKKSKETLGGRIFEFKINLLSFKEFLVFKEAELRPIGIYEKELKRLFNEFTLCLGFPEMVGIKKKDIIKRYVKEGIIDKVIYRDIPKLFKIKDVSKLESLMNMFMEEPGQIIEISDLADELDISRDTTSTYLGYLEKSFLLRKVYNYSKNRRKVERKLKKYYPAVPSIDLLFREDNHSKSRIFEWLMISQLDAEFFWRDPRKNEVDIVIPDGTPVEVKFGKITLEGLPEFMKNFKVSKGYVISYEKEEERKIGGRSISVIPAYKFLLDLPF